MSLAQRQTLGFVSYSAATGSSIIRCTACPFPAIRGSFHIVSHDLSSICSGAMSPAQRTKGKAKKAPGKLPTRFQPYRTAAPRPPRFHRFLDLPSELRELVYRFHAEQPDAIDVVGVWNSPLNPDILALFETCRQIRDEAAYTFFTKNTFCFLEPCDQWHGDNGNLERLKWWSWLNRIGKTSAQSLRNVQLRIRHERDPEYYTKLIKELSIRCPGITRLAIVEEKHASASKLANARIIWTWEPNMVETISGDRLETLMPSIALFKNLNILMLAGRDGPDDKHGNARRQRELLDRVCSRIRVRTQLITSDDAKRDIDACQVFWDAKKLYDGILVEAEGVPARIARADDGTFGSGNKTEYEMEEDVRNDGDSHLLDL
ncbi:hypothetical protein B0T16DRAFT_202218 [Cercophora newfieldiana]|uniref:2EXR domain-containing protein n=1 Tax=Cercophora newfieldiana TaxID=92897 RepID=A0AA40CKH1_9PEZI|nr:hypothetical protein B0T16DRAFT_202218 [Cercophora newfieldiana]